MIRNQSVRRHLHDKVTGSSLNPSSASKVELAVEGNIGLDLDSEPDIEYKSHRKFFGFFSENKKKTASATKDNPLTLITMMLALNKQQACQYHLTKNASQRL